MINFNIEKLTNNLYDQGKNEIIRRRRKKFNIQI
jgi:hypothetical protein